MSEEETEKPALALFVNAEPDEKGILMIKVAATDGIVASAFRFPYSQGRLVAKTLHDNIMKAVREAEDLIAVQSGKNGRKIQVAQPLDGQDVARFIRQQGQGKFPN